MTENDELQQALYNTKKNLIERVIKLSKKNPEIKVKKRFDPEKKAMSVLVEVPGYNIISLHVLDANNSLSKEIEDLKNINDDIAKMALTSTILTAGINPKLLWKMKKMSISDRKKFLFKLNDNVFYKIIIRMGYSIFDLDSKEKKRKIIEELSKDSKIEELLNENDDHNR